MISPGSMRAISAASPGAVAFGHAELAGGDIDPGEREAVVRGRGRAGARERQQVIVAPGIEQRILGKRAGRHQPHHVAAHDALAAALARLGGVFQLLADRDTVAERDQAVQIFVGALDRHAAHRNVAAKMLAALGQHDAERARGDFGVVEEHFVEIAHPVEQEAIRIGRLDLDILLHHRGHATDIVGRFGRNAAAGLGRKVRCLGHDGARGVHGALTLADGAEGFIGARIPPPRSGREAGEDEENYFTSFLPVIASRFL